MLGWLKKKNDSARIYMCVKELCWHLQRSTEIDVAKVLALGQLVRIEVLKPGGIADECFDRVFSFSRAELIHKYEMMETIRNQSNLELAHSKKVGKKIGLMPPPYMDGHIATFAKGVEVWMVTVGAGIKPELREQISDVWRLLARSQHQVPIAIGQIRETGRQIASDTGTQTNVYANIGTDSWIEACKFVPQFIREMQGVRMAGNKHPADAQQAPDSKGSICAEMIAIGVDILTVQSTLIDPAKKFDDFSLGYALGVFDALLQAKGLDNDAAAMAYVTIGFQQVFGEKYGTTLFSRALDLGPAGDESFLSGQRTGGTEIMNWLADKEKIPLGWADYSHGRLG